MVFLPQPNAREWSFLQPWPICELSVLCAGFCWWPLFPDVFISSPNSDPPLVRAAERIQRLRAKTRAKPTPVDKRPQNKNLRQNSSFFFSAFSLSFPLHMPLQNYHPTLLSDAVLSDFSEKLPSWWLFRLPSRDSLVIFPHFFLRQKEKRLFITAQ